MGNFKMSNPYSAGTHDTSSKHGTNSNYMNSGMKNADGSPADFKFLKNIGAGLKKTVGNIASGRGIAGWLNPAAKLGNIASKFLNKKKEGDTTAQVETQAPSSESGVVTDPTQETLADATTTGGTPSDDAVTPVQEEQVA